MKRTITPALRDRNLVRKCSQTKFHNKDTKKVSINRTEQNHDQIHMIRKKIQEPMPIKEYLQLKDNQNRGGNRIKSEELNGSMRKIAVGWVIQVTHKLRLCKDTLFHGVYILDQIIGKQKNLNSTNLQLMVISSMFMSAKYQEIYPPHIQVFIQATANTYTRKQIIDMEAKILNSVKFELTLPTRYTFLSYSLEHEADCYDKRYHYFLLYLLQISLLTQWQTYSQNQITQAVLFLARKVMKKVDNRTPTSKLMECAYKLMSVWNQNENGIVAALYDTDRFCFVGGLRIIY